MDGLSYIYDTVSRRYLYSTITSNLSNLSSYLFFNQDILSNSLVADEDDSVFDYSKIFIKERYISTGVAKYKGFLVADEERYHVDNPSYSKIINDPVNVVNDTLDEDVYLTIEQQIKELQQRVGNTRNTHKRKVEHIGLGMLTLEDLHDISHLVGETIQFIPPLPTDYDDPERINLRTTDKGFVDYIKDNLQTIQSAGQKTIIWSEAEIPKGTLVEADDIKVKSVHVPDLEGTLDTALEEVTLSDEVINSEFRKFLSEKSTWSVFNIPGRSVIRSNTDGIYMVVLGEKTSSVYLKPDGVIDMNAVTVNITAGTVNVI